MTDFLAIHALWSKCVIKSTLVVSTLSGSSREYKPTGGNICIADGQLVRINIVLIPPEDWKRPLQDFTNYFMRNASQIGCSYECKHGDLTIFREYSPLSFHKSETGIEFGMETQLNIAQDHHGKDLELKLILDCSIETFGQTSIKAKGADNEEQSVRRLLEFDRFRPTHIPPRAIAYRCKVVEPVEIKSRWKEVTPFESQLSLIVRNMHPTQTILIYGVAMHRKDSIKASLASLHSVYDADEGTADAAKRSDGLTIFEQVDEKGCELDLRSVQAKMMRAHGKRIDTRSSFDFKASNAHIFDDGPLSVSQGSTVEFVFTIEPSQTHSSRISRVYGSSSDVEIKERRGNEDHSVVVSKNICSRAYLHEANLLGESFSEFSITWAESSKSVSIGEIATVCRVVTHEAFWSIGTAWANPYLYAAATTDLSTSDAKTAQGDQSPASAFVTPLKRDSSAGDTQSTTTPLSALSKARGRRRNLTPHKVGKSLTGLGSIGEGKTHTNRATPTDNFTDTGTMALTQSVLLSQWLTDVKSNSGERENHSLAGSISTTPVVAASRSITSPGPESLRTPLSPFTPFSRLSSVHMDRDQRDASSSTWGTGALSLTITGPPVATVNKSFTITLQLMNCTTQALPSFTVVTDAINLEDVNMAYRSYLVFESETAFTSRLDPGDTYTCPLHILPLDDGPLNLIDLYIRDSDGFLHGFLQFYSIFVNKF